MPRYNYFLAALVILVGLAVLMYCLLGGRQALAHKSPAGMSYPQECCRGASEGGDCAPISEKELKLLWDGSYIIKISGEMFAPPGVLVQFPNKNFRWSTDGLYHRCLQNPKDLKSYTYCLFIPAPGV